MILWLPRWRTATNPFYSSIPQISEPDRTRSLPNRYLNLRYEHFAAESSVDFGRACVLEEQGQRFNEVCPGIFDRRTLAGDVQFRAQSNKAVIFPLDDRGQALPSLHNPSLQQLSADSPPLRFDRKCCTLLM